MTVAKDDRSTLPALDWRRLMSKGQNVGLICLGSLFAVAHITNVIDGRVTSVPFAVDYLVLTVLVIVRRPSNETSTRLRDWIFAGAGTWIPLLMWPDQGPTHLAGIGLAVQFVGVTLAIVSFIYLGKSFGLVAANRGLKTNGPYRVVRHPAYAGHLLTLGGFLLANPSLPNLCFSSIAAVALICRIHAEERILTSPDYASYKDSVPRRLVPGVY